jgi:methylglutamate dehydrogenase subunit D
MRLLPRSPLAGLAIAGTAPAATGVPGVLVAERRPALATVTARRHTMRPLTQRVREAFGIDLPVAPRRRGAEQTAFAWAGPGQWLATAEGGVGDAFVARLRHEIRELASISDQTDGRVVLRIRGPGARATLAKGLPIDLHPGVFVPGDVAVSVIGHIGVHLWQVDDEPSYELAVPTSYAASFWHWLTAAAAEFRLRVETA